MIRGLAVGVAAIVVATSAAGCTSESKKPTQPYAAEVSRIAANGSPLAKRVLEDGKVTAAEYSELQQLYVRCMADLGIEATVDTGAGGLSAYTVEHPDGVDQAVIDKANAECTTSSGLASVEPLYNAMRVNPNNVDFSQLEVDCLIKSGAVSKNFTTADLNSPDFASRDIDPDAFRQCTSDPQGLLNK